MLSNVVVLLSAAILVAIIFHRLKLPSIVAFITAGVLVGPFGLGLVASLPQAGNITEAAAILLMFTIGLEFSVKELAHYRRPILVLGLGQVLITIFVFSFIFWLGFGFSTEKALIISFIIAPSSTAIVLKLLTDNRDLDTPYGRGATSILILQDIAVIPLMVAIPFLIKRQEVTDSVVDSIIPLLILAALVVLVIFVMGKYLLPQLLEKVVQTKNRELFFFTVLLICISAGAFMHSVGLSYSLGAFVAGMLLAGSHYGKQATAEILPLRDSFLSLFFVAIGMMLDLGFLIQNIHKVLLIGLGIIAIKSAIIFLILWLSGSTSNIARAVTVLLFQFGEFSFIITDLGVNHGLLAEKERQFFVAIAILSLAATPILFNKIPWILRTQKFDNLMSLKQKQWLTQFRAKILKGILPAVSLETQSEEDPLNDHVIIIGYGIAGQSLSRVLKHLQKKFSVIELNAETVRIHSDQSPIIYGDASNVEILKKVGVERARLVLVVASGLHMLDPIITRVRQLNPMVRIIARTNYIQDTRKLVHVTNASFVVSEIESTLEVIYETLREFNVEGTPAHEIVRRLRGELRSQLEQPPFMG